MNKLKIAALHFLVGFIAGAINKWMDEPSQDVISATGGLLGDIGTYPGLWILILVALVVSSRLSAKLTVLATMLFFVGVSIGYYSYSQVVLGYSGVRYVSFWLVASGTLVPLATMLVLYTRNLVAQPKNTSIISSALIGMFMAVPMATALGLLLEYNSAENVVILLANVVVQLLIAFSVMLFLAPTHTLRWMSIAWGAGFSFLVLGCFGILFYLLSM